MAVSEQGFQNGRASRQEACEFIEKNLHQDDLTPAAVASALGISVRKLHILFSPTGQTFSRYVLSRRLEMARLQLGSDLDRPIIDVALACGFKSSSVFYRGFREAFGMNPSRYRQSLRELPAMGPAQNAERLSEI